MLCLLPSPNTRCRNAAGLDRPVARVELLLIFLGGTLYRCTCNNCLLRLAYSLLIEDAKGLTRACTHTQGVFRGHTVVILPNLTRMSNQSEQMLGRERAVQFASVCFDSNCKSLCASFRMQVDS